MLNWLKKLKFEKIVRGNLKNLMQLAYMKSKDRDLAEDLVQETCLKAYNAFLQLKPSEEIQNPKSWLFKILINTHIDYVRKKRFDTVEINSIDIEDKKDGISQIETSHFFKDLNGALNKLEPQYRVVIYLADVNQYSYIEISDMLGVSVSAVTSRLHRARQALRMLLTQSGYSQEYLSIGTKL